MPGQAPIHTTDKRGFGNILQQLHRKYYVPGRKHFSDTQILKLYNKIKYMLNYLLGDGYSSTKTVDFTPIIQGQEEQAELPPVSYSI